MPMDEGDAQGSLCLEWKQLNYYVPAQEQSNYSFWNECRKQRELRILHDGKTRSHNPNHTIEIIVGVVNLQSAVT